MVAKINVGSSLFGSLAYNQHKIDQEKGHVLCSNKMTENRDGNFNIHTCMADFENQLPKGIKTEKPIIHISLNPHPDDKLTNEQLSAIAQEYMEKLGYGNQPYMVYKHEDIGRHHLHIVSLRVDETGKKINDKFEYRRSKDITRELEQKYGLRPAEKQQREAHQPQKIDVASGDVKSQIANVIKPLATRYHFQSFNEYKALLALYNIKVEQVKGIVREKQYNGLVYSATNNNGQKVGNPFKSSLFGKSVGYNAVNECCQKSKDSSTDKKFREQTKQRVAWAVQVPGNCSDFEKELSKQGVSVLFRENEQGRIYGATFIDHNNQCVFNGSRLGKEFSANVFNDLYAVSTTTPNGLVAKNISKLSHSHETPNSLFGVAGVTDNALEGVAGIFSAEVHGQDSEEEAFARRMKRKKKKQRRL
jgi:hypothetical protein